MLFLKNTKIDSERSQGPSPGGNGSEEIIEITCIDVKSIKRLEMPGLHLGKPALFQNEIGDSLQVGSRQIAAFREPQTYQIRQ